MPGVIGASILPPRPARGYRFHSPQVEIIVGSLSARSRNHFHQIFSRAAPVCAAIQTTCYRKRSGDQRTITISRLPRMVTDKAEQSTAILRRVLQFGRAPKGISSGV